MTHGRDRPVAYWLSNLYPAALALGGVVVAVVLPESWGLLPLLVWASQQMLDLHSGSAVGRTMYPPGGRRLIYSIVLVLFGALLFYLMVVVPIVGFAFEPSDLDNATRNGRWLNRFSQSRLWLGILGALTVWLCSVGIALVLRVLTMIFGRR